MYGVSRLDYSRLRELRYPLYGTLIGLLVIVLLLAKATRGAHAWIPCRSSTCSRRSWARSSWSSSWRRSWSTARRSMGRHTTARVMLIALLPTLIVMAEPDLGSALVYIAGALAMLFVAGAPWRHFAALGALAAVAVALTLVALPKAGVEVLKPYQVDRLTAFLHPSANKGKEGYQQQQSLIAIGSGEKTGRGVANATQTR